MSKDFSVLVPISLNSERWQIDEENLKNAYSHDEIWSLVSDESKIIMMSDIKTKLFQQLPDHRLYIEHGFLSIPDRNNPSIHHKFVRVDCLRYLFIHLPKTAGRYFYSNYRVCKHPTGREHIHHTFNPDHSSYSGLKLFPLIDVERYWDQNTAYSLDVFLSLITIVRNPFDWLASFYFTNEGKGWQNIRDNICKEITFENFIKSICTNDEIGKEINQKIYPFDQGLTSPLFNNSDALCVSNILFFERIKQGVDSLNLCAKKDNQVSSSMQTFKISGGRDGYKNLYSEELIKLVYDKFRFDFEFLGYDFDGLRHDKSHLSFEKSIHKDALVGNLL